MRARTWLLLILAASACQKGEGTVLVTVTADPAIASVKALQVHAEHGMRSADFTATLPQPGPLPPEQTFALTAPASLGSVHVKVTAVDENDVVVGVGERDAAITGGKRTDVTVSLAPPGAGGDGGVDGGLDGGGDAGTPAAPRLLGPISGSTATSKRPTLRWVLPAGVSDVQVDVCPTRDCASTLQPVAVDGAGTSGVPMMDLPRGVVFWRVRGTSAGQAVASATWELSIPGKTAARDVAQGPYHDFNGDGQADVIVGAQGANNAAGVKSGRAYLVLFFGSTPVLLDSNDGAGSLFGSAVASAGDVDGDGQAEALVGAFYATNAGGEAKAGRAYLYKLDAQFKPVLVHTFDGADGPNGHLGIALGPAGDVNGDGYADFAITSDANGGDGRVYLYLGSASGPSFASPVILDGAAGSFEHFGSQVTTAGDLNGDGYGDLAVGAYVATVQGQSGAGRLYVFLGGPSGIAKQPAQVIDSPDGANTYFTQMLAPLGDVNGDGYGDVAVSANAASVGGVANVGRVYIYHGGPDGMLHQAKVLDGPDGANDNWGGQNGGHGWVDLNADGYHDLVVTSTAGTTGKIYVFLGGPNGITTAQPTPLSSTDSGWGSQVAPGDFNMDGYGDLVVGASGVNNSLGRIYLHPGGANGPSAAPSSMYDGTDTAGGFGGFLGRRGPLRRRR